MIYSVENTSKIGRPVAVSINGRQVEALWAVTVWPFVFAKVVCTYKDGSPIRLGDGISMRLAFGLGRVARRVEA